MHRRSTTVSHTQHWPCAYRHTVVIDSLVAAFLHSMNVGHFKAPGQCATECTRQPSFGRCGIIALRARMYNVGDIELFWLYNQWIFEFVVPCRVLKEKLEILRLWNEPIHYNDSMHLLNYCAD